MTEAYINWPFGDSNFRHEPVNKTIITLHIYTRAHTHTADILYTVDVLLILVVTVQWNCQYILSMRNILSITRTVKPAINWNIVQDLIKT